MFRLNSASLTFGRTDEGNQFRRRQKLTRTKFSFKCTRKNSMLKHRWDSYIRHVKAMVVDHFIRSIRYQSKTLTKHYEELFTGSEAPSGPTELSKVQRDKRKLGTMCHALIAEHMFGSPLTLIRTRAMMLSSTGSPKRIRPAMRVRKLLQTK
jgi:hypothetical protein